MGERAVLRMTELEVADFLREGRRAQVATHNPDGTIHLVPMSYVLYDGRVTFWTAPVSRKVANLRLDPRVTCLVETGDDFGSFRAVQMTGEASLHEDVETSRRVGEALFSLTVGELTDDLRGYVARLAPDRVAIAVEARRVVSWDHRKLAGLRPDQVGS